MNFDWKGTLGAMHLKCVAYDIATPTTNAAFRIVRALLAHGYRRVLIYKDFVHVDEDDSKPQDILKYMSERDSQPAT